MYNASSLFLTAGPRLSDVARVSDNLSAMRKQIAECFLTFYKFGPMRKQIIECSAPIRRFRSIVLSGLLSWDYSLVRKERDSGNERLYLRFPLSLICQYPLVNDIGLSEAAFFGVPGRHRKGRISIEGYPVPDFCRYAILMA